MGKYYAKITLEHVGDRNIVKMTGNPMAQIELLTDALSVLVVHHMDEAADLHEVCQAFADSLEASAKRIRNKNQSSDDDDAELPYDWEGGTE